MIVIETDLSKESVINRISELTGNRELVLSAPFSGTVKGDSFRITRAEVVIHPFIPVAKGRVKSLGQHSTIELTFVFPWLGIAAIATVFVVLSSMAWPPPWEAVLVLLFVGGMSLMMRAMQKKEFIKTLRDKFK